MASDHIKSATSQKCSPPGYTIELQLDQQLVVVIGGGRVARRKLTGLLAAGAIISLIDPAPLVDLPQSPQLTHQRHSYRPEDLFAARLVFTATGDPQTNARIAADAAEQGILCCRIDSAQDSDFATPAHLLRSPLSFTVSSGGTNPAMSATLRDLLGKMIPGSWQTAAELTTAIRRKVLTEEQQIPYNQQVLLQLVEQGLFEFIEHSDTAAIDRLLLKHFGTGFSLKDLRFSLP